jgi:hypothetical protein
MNIADDEGWERLITSIELLVDNLPTDNQATDNQAVDNQAVDNRNKGLTAEN